MNDSSPTAGHSTKGLWVLVALILYVLAQGPLHGLYYNEHLPDAAATAFIWLYKPLDAIELRLPKGNFMSRYKYWWYIYIHYGEPPVNGEPPPRVPKHV